MARQEASMSSAERQRTESSKHLCQRCRDRKARFRYRGVVRADRDHSLCFECYRREVNRARARRLAEAAAPPRSPLAHQQAAGSRVLDEQRLAHRRRMLDYLQRQSSVASME